ncbi:MAG: hypothetical protein F6K50_03380 [Moorea sp. SIO3I7]|uniref:tectonin domain-containing protein n=1 Tax=unclassified Moorena TaxID=2683338 RepID=UPI0013C06B51|nr:MULTISPECIES: tectonin domain-containing protein [unclassified Moorena]NEN94601.1 hypothetical protein [Moorena sp. SIO3I7]NEO06724.1 hypothetical protein [Moorena sp. SIO3I8]NEO20264.1 hypothetical protein [Moorena sp. SIO4A5]NEQ60202.1 hypothetical protein [Moorena sp. SIO4A1]
MSDFETMLDISVGSDGTAFGIDNQQRVFKYSLQGWQRVDPDFEAVQIAVGDSENVWAIGAGELFTYKLEGNSFVQQPQGSKAIRISVGIADPTQVWIVGTDTNTYKLENGSFVQTPSGSKALEISVYDTTTVWIIGTDTNTYELKNGSFVQTPSGSEGKQISVDASENVWLIGTDDNYYKLVNGAFIRSSIPWEGSGLNSLLAANRLLRNRVK